MFILLLQMTDLTIQNLEALQVGVDGTSVCVTQSVLNAHTVWYVLDRFHILTSFIQFILKCQEMNENFKAVEPLAMQL